MWYIESYYRQFFRKKPEIRRFQVTLMKSGKRILFLMTVLFLGLALFLGLLDRTPEAGPLLSLVLPSGSGSETIDCWEDGQGDLYLFLPSYARLSQAQLRSGRSGAALEGRSLKGGLSCETLRTDTLYTLSYSEKGNTRQLRVTFLQSQSLPTLYIDTASGSMDYIHAQKGNEESGILRLYAQDGALECRGNLDTLKGRGNATWLSQKKPYSLTLSQEADLLGMGAARNWILLSNPYDSSNLRNKIVYDFAQELGLAYSPRCQWVDLYLNGQYAGLYLLTTRNEIHPQRVNISQGSSFLVSMELRSRLEEQNLSFVSTDRSGALAFRIQDSALSKDTVQAMLQSLENAVLAPDGVDSVTGKSYLELIDLESWAARYLIDEVFCNFDGGSLSQFFYYDGGSDSGKIYAGPIWDMDNTLSRGYFPPNTLWAGRPHLWSEEDSPLYAALWNKEAFRAEVLRQYRELFRPGVERLLESTLDSYPGRITQAARLNALRWAMDSGSGQPEIIREGLIRRLEFLDDYFFGDTDYCLVQEADPGGVWRCYAVPRGQSLSYEYGYTDTEQGRFAGYRVAGTGESFDPYQPIESDLTFCPVWESQQEEAPSQRGSGSLPLWTMAPLAGLLGILALLFLIDLSRWRRNGGNAHERAQKLPPRTEV